VFEAHKNGKKHKKGMERLKLNNIDPSNVNTADAAERAALQEYEQHKPVAKTEFLIKGYINHLKTVRDDTKSHVERKQALTEEERVLFFDPVR
jgi:splicing factor 3A subunit 3